jgi:hypothetical protein
MLSMEDNYSKENSEEKEINSVSAKEKQTSKFSIIGFAVSFIIMLIPYAGIFFVYKLDKGMGVIGAFFLAILFSVIGIILWAIFKFAFKKRVWGLGFLMGGLATLLFMFIFSDGCGLRGNL